MFCKVLISSCLKAVTRNIYFSTDTQIVVDLVTPGEDDVPSSCNKLCFLLLVCYCSVLRLLRVKLLFPSLRMLSDQLKT